MKTVFKRRETHFWLFSYESDCREAGLLQLT